MLSGICRLNVSKSIKHLRKIDIKKIQKHLVQIGNLPERVLKDKEFKGFSRAEMKQAAQTVADNYKGLEILLTDPERCLTLIQKQFEQGARCKCQTYLRQYSLHIGRQKRLGKPFPIRSRAI